MLVRFNRFGHLFSSLIPVLGFLFWLLPGAASADMGGLPGRSTPANIRAAIQLIAAPELVQGVYRAAVEVELEPSAVTYWRQPGEAGVPPRFSFAGSENVASVEVLYPAPARLDEDGIEAFGYRGGATFPLRVKPQDAGKPSRLKLTLDYAVCETICVPIEGVAETILPSKGANDVAERLKAAETRVPMPLPRAESDAKLAVMPQKEAAKPTWTLSWKGAAALDDLFVEAPEGWFFETHKTGADQFSLVAVEAPTAQAAGPIDVRLTATGQPQSYEFTVKLDPTAVKLR